jgi:hypothetical protein
MNTFILINREQEEASATDEVVAGEIYSLDGLVEMVNLSRREILKYCLWGTIRSVTDVHQDRLCFDASAIRLLRRVEYLETVHHLSPSAIRRLLMLGHDWHV